MARRPKFLITSGDSDLTPGLLAVNCELEIVDSDGVNADDATLTLDDKGGATPAPKRGQMLALSGGYVGQVVSFGTFKVQSVAYSGYPQKIVVSLQSADPLSEQKKRRSEAFQPPRFNTYGQMIRYIAQRSGLTATISADIASVPLRYEAQTEEDDLAFLSRLQEQFDASISVKSGRLVMVPRGKGLSASGQPLDTVAVTRPGNVLGYSAGETEKPAHEAALATHLDRRKMQLKTEKATSTDHGPEQHLRFPLYEAEKAQRVAKTQAERLRRSCETASFEIDGNPQARAEMLAEVSGVRSNIDGRWRIKTATHRWSGDKAYVTSLDCEAP